MSRSRVVNLASYEQFTAINLLSDLGHKPGPLIIPSVARIALVWNLEDGKQVFNTLCGRYQGLFHGSVSEANAIVTGLTSGGAWTALATFLATGTSLAGVHILDLNSANQSIIANTAPGAAGTAAGQSLPNETAVVVTERTALSGKANRGRIYLPGFAVDAVALGNVVAAACITAINNWALTIPTVLNASGYALVIGQPERLEYTGKTGTLHPHRDATSQPVTSLSTRDNHWDSQRRRGLG